MRDKRLADLPLVTVNPGDNLGAALKALDKRVQQSGLPAALVRSQIASPRERRRWKQARARARAARSAQRQAEAESAKGASRGPLTVDDRPGRP